MCVLEMDAKQILRVALIKPTLVSFFLVVPGLCASSVLAQSCPTPPASGDWIIDSDCTLSSSAVVPENVVVQNDSTLTIPSRRQLNIDFQNNNLRVRSNSRVRIRNGGKVFHFPLGHTFLDNTDGVAGYYLKRVDGAVIARLRETNLFYPASTIKVLQHLHAMRAVEGGLNLDSTSVQVYSGAGGIFSDSCSDDHANQTPIRTGTLRQELTRMMLNSDNQATNAIQELFGNSAAAGRAAINQTAASVVGMSGATALNHKLACGGPNNNPANSLTLVDIALLYEQVATEADVLQPGTAVTFYQLMLNQNNDGSLLNALNSIVDQEVVGLDLSAADVQLFKSLIRFAHKAGNIGTGFESDAGWVQLPLDSGSATRDYVFAWFIDTATTNTIPLSFSQRGSEMMRRPIRSALTLWQ